MRTLPSARRSWTLVSASRVCSSGYTESIAGLSAAHELIEEQYTVFNDIFANKLGLTSQEIQLSGKSKRVDWVAGAYYWSQETVGRNLRYSTRSYAAERPEGERYSS